MGIQMPEGQFMAAVKVGEKGQIVIPKDAREMFNIKPGDMLMLMADIEKGIAIVSYEELVKNGLPGQSEGD